MSRASEAGRAAAALAGPGFARHRRALLGQGLALGAACAAVALGGCTTTTTPGGVPIDTRHSSRGQDSRVLFLVIHYTVADLPISIKVLTENDVSAHYLLSDETPPRIFRLVPEERRAWHSGPSAWKGHRLLNASSIGIEIVHPGFRLGPPPGRERVYLPFPEAQIDALIPLVKDIVARHQIRPERILGHGEVSPQFKQDPGPTFPWRLFSDLGITPPWPDALRVAAQRALFEAQPAGMPDVPWFQEMLAQHGYAIEKTGQLDAQMRNVLMNFQMRYRPARYDGLPDAESAALLWVLNHPLPGLPGLQAPATPAAPPPSPAAPALPAFPAFPRFPGLPG